MFHNAQLYAQGYIGKTVTEIFTSKHGKQLVNFSLGVVTDKQECTWFQITVFGDQAVALVKKGLIVKGQSCMIKGYPKFKTYKTKEGKTQVNLSVWAEWIFIQDKLISKQEHLNDLNKANMIEDSVSDEVAEGLEDQMEAPF